MTEDMQSLPVFDQEPEIRKILVIKLGALGDFVMSLGWFQSIREKFPTAHITVMTASSLVGLAKKTRLFDDYIIDNRSNKLLEFWRIAKKEIADREFDLVLDGQRNNRTRFRYFQLVRLFSKRSLYWGTIENGGFEIQKLSGKKTRFFCKLTRSFLPLVYQPVNLSCCIEKNESLPELPKKMALLIPGCSPTNLSKRWSAESYAQVATWLASRGISSVVIGTNDESQAIEQICQGNPMALNFCNKTALMDIPYLASQSLFVVGNDTGPTHMASFVGAQTYVPILEKYKHCFDGRNNVQVFPAEDLNQISPESIIALMETHLK